MQTFFDSSPLCAAFSTFIHFRKVPSCQAPVATNVDTCTYRTYTAASRAMRRAEKRLKLWREREQKPLRNGLVQYPVQAYLDCAKPFSAPSSPLFPQKGQAPCYEASRKRTRHRTCRTHRDGDVGEKGRSEAERCRCGSTGQLLPPSYIQSTASTSNLLHVKSLGCEQNGIPGIHGRRRVTF